MARGVAPHRKGRRYDCSLISLNSTGIELAAKSGSGTSLNRGTYTCLFLTEESRYIVLAAWAERFYHEYTLVALILSAFSFAVSQFRIISDQLRNFRIGEEK